MHYLLLEGFSLKDLVKDASAGTRHAKRCVIILRGRD